MTDQQQIKNLNAKLKFAQSWDELKDGQKVKLIMYDEFGFLKPPGGWVECFVTKTNGKPILKDAEGAIWHDCLFYPWELNIMQKPDLDIQYFDQAHLMHLEGTANDKPEESEIIEHARENNYKASNVDIWYDGMFKFYRFNADIEKIK